MKIKKSKGLTRTGMEAKKATRCAASKKEALPDATSVDWKAYYASLNLSIDALTRIEQMKKAWERDFPHLIGKAGGLPALTIKRARRTKRSASAKVHRLPEGARQIDWSRYSSKIDFGPDPLAYLKKLRDEWDRGYSG